LLHVSSFLKLKAWKPEWVYFILTNSESLRAGRAGDRITVGGKISRTHPDRPWAPGGILYNAYRVSFPWAKRPGRDCDHPHHLVSILKSGDTPLIPAAPS